MAQEPARRPHDERVHRLTTAEGPGSPGGLAKRGRAVAARGEDPGRPRVAPAPPREEDEEGDAEPGEGAWTEGGRGAYEAGARVGPGDPRRAHGVAEAMAEGRFGRAERGEMGGAGRAAAQEGLLRRGTPRGEAPVRPPRSALGPASSGGGVWRCCGEDWRGPERYGEHVRVSHGGDPRGQSAPGGSGQGVDARARPPGDA